MSTKWIAAAALSAIGLAGCALAMDTRPAVRVVQPPAHVTTFDFGSVELSREVAGGWGELAPAECESGRETFARDAQPAVRAAWQCYLDSQISTEVQLEVRVVLAADGSQWHMPMALSSRDASNALVACVLTVFAAASFCPYDVARQIRYPLVFSPG